MGRREGKKIYFIMKRNHLEFLHSLNSLSNESTKKITHSLSSKLVILAYCCNYCIERLRATITQVLNLCYKVNVQSRSFYL